MVKIIVNKLKYINPLKAILIKLTSGVQKGMCFLGISLSKKNRLKAASSKFANPNLSVLSAVKSTAALAPNILSNKFVFIV